MKFKVLNAGSVSLEDFAGSDVDVVNAAKVSFAKHVNFMGESEIKLLIYLMKNKHATPFEHNYFKFHIKCPIFVAREFMRHRIGSFNEMSMRYHQPELEFFLPSEDSFRMQTGKPGAYTFEPIANDNGICEYFQNQMDTVYKLSKEVYEKLLSHGVAKELARSVIPVAVYTEFYWSVNARSLMNFISLRNTSHAQEEIRLYAEVIETCFSQVMPITHAAFSECGHVAI